MSARLRASGEVYVRVYRNGEGRWVWAVLRRTWLGIDWTERRGVEETAERARTVGLRQRRGWLSWREARSLAETAR